MPVFKSIREIRNCKRYQTVANRRKSGDNKPETCPIMSLHQRNTDTECEKLILTQQEVDKLIKNYIAPFTKQLEEMT